MWNRRDADALASLFGGSKVGFDGSQMSGQIKIFGRLRIALLFYTPAAFHGRPHMAERLTEELTDAVRQGQLMAEAR